MLAAQREYFEWQQYAASFGMPSYFYKLRTDGLLLRRSPLDGATQTVVPIKLLERVIQ